MAVASTPPLVLPGQEWRLRRGGARAHWAGIGVSKGMAAGADLTPEWAFGDADRVAMDAALAEARAAASAGDVPIGAVVVGPDGTLLSRAGNRREQDDDPTAHAEILALRAAARRVGSWRLAGCALYVTLEPCAMCASACVLARLDCVVWAAPDPKGGFCGSLGNLLDDPRLNHRVGVRGGLRMAEAADLLAAFFANLRGQR
jgi:tRNA(adenine34) deaminase